MLICSMSAPVKGRLPPADLVDTAVVVAPDPADPDEPDPPDDLVTGPWVPPLLPVLLFPPPPDVELPPPPPVACVVVGVQRV